MGTITCLYTTVVNTSGETRTFGFLPPWGRTLASAAEFSAIGTVVDWIQARGGMSPVPEKQFKALKRAMEDGDLEIKSTPVVALFDAVAANTKVLRLNNATLGSIDPCWV
jgi:hypothetical protein